MEGSRIVCDQVAKIEGPHADKVIAVLNPYGLIESKLLPIHPTYVGDARLDTPTLRCLPEQLLFNWVLASEPWREEVKSCRDPDDQQEEPDSPNDINHGHLELAQISHQPCRDLVPWFRFKPTDQFPGHAPAYRTSSLPSCRPLRTPLNSLPPK